MFFVSKVTGANGKISENDKETAQILCDQFQQVFANHDYSDLVNLVTESTSDLSPRICLPKMLFIKDCVC